MEPKAKVAGGETMKRTLKTAIAGLILASSLAGPAPAGPAADAEDIKAWEARGDHAPAMRLWRSQAEQGNAGGQFYLGFLYEKGDGVPQSYPEALKWYRLAADQGFDAAQASIGFLYDSGHGVPQSYVEALKWYRLAADQGQAFAQTRFGVLYEYGHGVRQNYAEALTWYRLAADQGRAEAQFFLGNMYVKGQGVPEDYVLAHMWFTLATAKGDEGAKEGRNMLAEHMTAAQIAEAQRLASEWKPKRKRM